MTMRMEVEGTTDLEEVSGFYLSQRVVESNLETQQQEVGFAFLTVPKNPKMFRLFKYEIWFWEEWIDEPTPNTIEFYLVATYEFEGDACDRENEAYRILNMMKKEYSPVEGF